MTADEILRRYGFYDTGAGVGGGDVLGQGAVQSATRELQAAGLPVPHFLNAVESQQVKDPHGPGNGEGGSDLSNIMRLAGVVGGVAGLTGGMTMPWGGSEATMNTQSLSQPYQTAVGGWNSQAGGGMDWLDQLIGDSSGWADGGGTTYQGDFGYPSNVGGGLSDAQLSEMQRAAMQDSGEQLGAGNTAQNAGSPDWLKQELMNRPELAGALAQNPSLWQTIQKLLGGASGAKGAASGRSPLASILGGDGSGTDWLKTLGGLGSAGLGAYGAQQQQESLEKLAREQMAAEQGRYSEQRDINQSRYQDSQKLAAEATGRAVAARGEAQGIVAPSQARYEGSYAPGFTMAGDPGFMDALNLSSKATLHGLSVQGNPSDSPNAWAQSLSDNYTKMAYPALKDYRTMNANTGFSGPYASVAANAPQTTMAGTPNSVGFGNPSAGADQSAAAIGAGSNVFGAVGKGIANITNPPQTLSDWIAANQNKGSSIFGN